MNWEMICLDIDGTLMTNDEKLLPEVKFALRDEAEKGTKIALVTGRMPEGVVDIEKQLGIECVKICVAGTYALLGNTPVYSKYLPQGVLPFLYKQYAMYYEIPLWIFREEKWYVTGMDDYVRNTINKLHFDPIIEEPESFIAKWESDHITPNKILFSASNDILLDIHHKLTKLNSPEFDVAFSDTCFLEIFPKGVNKGSALSAVCRQLGINPKNTIAFGDQELDIPFLKTAGYGVAMGNAIDELKAVADFVTTSNNEGGVAHALKLLNKTSCSSTSDMI